MHKKGRDLWCTECDAFYLVCETCSEQLTTDDTVNGETLPNLDARAALCQFVEYDKCVESEPECITINLEHLNTNHVSYSTITAVQPGDDPLDPDCKRWITGPDGGYYHTWRCRNCNHVSHATDK